MPASDAQKRATQKYIEKNLEQIRFWMPKGSKDAIKTFAASRGLSMAEYLKGLLRDDMGSTYHDLFHGDPEGQQPKFITCRNS